MKKLYVKEQTHTSVDGEKLQRVTVYESKVKKFKYIIFK